MGIQEVNGKGKKETSGNAKNAHTKESITVSTINSCTVCGENLTSTDKKLNKKELANRQKRYRNILTRDEKELPPIPPRPSGKQDKLAKSDAHNLWERLKHDEASVLLFAKDAYVPFTNIRAEQDLRMEK